MVRRDTEDTSTDNAAIVVNCLLHFEGKDKHASRVWKIRIKIHVNESAPAIYSLSTQQSAATWPSSRQNPPTYCMYYSSTSSYEWGSYDMEERQVKRTESLSPRFEVGVLTFGEAAQLTFWIPILNSCGVCCSCP